MEQTPSHNDPTSNSSYDVSYTANTKDLRENEYRDLGLSFWQGFEGKEFNTYLGPAAYIDVQFLGESVFEGVTQPESMDFTPPLGGESISFTTLEWIFVMSQNYVFHQVSLKLRYLRVYEETSPEIK